MRSIELSTATWRKSSYSNQDGGECVEVCDDFANILAVRDSKDPQGPALVFPAESWTAFVSAVKDGRFAA
ncbi:DUF397 domain-containing protein [Actinacidiphila acididurans]|uniref:DUF397 domain-containing protein n=1 Tax=Actinacidiphila acididurans TaxID=2784346 RepID=A0ABS2TWY3_9ACTN|nr:DUF397 domain-containing protein [Actinacidiphila acididurans]MBM9507857.1 DUF397 domain-containing protein [Actinacidiphila acididurans]